MPDYTHLTPANDLDWKPRLSTGDIVSYAFPVSERKGGPSPKTRPCLVLDVSEVDGARYALLAYGTSARTKANCGYEVEVRGTARAAAGLDRRTRFVGARRILVPLTDPDFVTCRELGTPVLGRLEGGPFERLERLRTWFGVEQELIAQRQEGLRQTHTAHAVVSRRRRSWPRRARARPTA